MSVGSPERAVAKRNDTPVRIDNAVLEDCRVAASMLGQTLGEFISDTLRPIVRKIVEDTYQKKYGKTEPPKPKR